MKKVLKWNLTGLNKIVGDKIIMRYPKVSDAKNLLSKVNKPEIWGNIKLDPNIRVSLKKELGWIEKLSKLRSKNKEIHWLIIDKETKDIVGCGGFNDKTRADYRLGVVGIWISKEYWGKGYSVQALKILLRTGFTKLKFNKIEADVFSYNIRSRKHLEKQGFVLEGAQKEKITFGKRKIDNYLFGMTKSEWVKLKNKK